MFVCDGFCTSNLVVDHCFAITHCVSFSVFLPRTKVARDTKARRGHG
jgi:hypothetical protein